MNNLVSVIVPIYNIESYLSQCIDSIIAQTYKNIEIILVNDGSTDNCDNICKEYAKKDKRIQYFYKKNGGLSSARNYGIKKSRGEYLCFIDSDDYIDKLYVQKLLDFTLKYDCDITVCGYKEFNEADDSKSKIVYNRYASDNRVNRVINGRQLWEEWCLYHSNFFDYAYIVIFTKMFKRAIFKHFKFKNTIHEDEFAAIRIYRLAKRIGVINDCLYTYRKCRKGSITDLSAKNPKLKQLLVFKFSIERTIYFIKHKYSTSVINFEKKNWIENYFHISKFNKVKYWFKVRYLITQLDKIGLLEKTYKKRYKKSQLKLLYLFIFCAKSFFRIMLQPFNIAIKKIINTFIIRSCNDVFLKQIAKCINSANVLVILNKNNNLTKNRLHVFSDPKYLTKNKNISYIAFIDFDLNGDSFIKNQEFYSSASAIITNSFNNCIYLNSRLFKNVFYVPLSAQSNIKDFDIFRDYGGGLKYFVLRVLLYLGSIDFDKFYKLTHRSFDLKTNKICINLSESVSRRDFFKKNNVDNFIFFPAIKNKIGWLGCALSYKYLSKLCLESKFNYFLLCEDDITIRNNIQIDYDTILNFMSDDGSIDVINTCSTTAIFSDKKKRIKKLGNVSFIKTDGAASFVFNFYNRNALMGISRYDEKKVITTDDVNFQIDQYMLRNDWHFNIYLSCPFFVDHSLELISDINGVYNSELRYNKDIDDTEKYINNLINRSES